MLARRHLLEGYYDGDLNAFVCAAEALLAAGSVGEAIAQFEALRQWDSLLLCLRLLDKGPQALDLVQRRLQACSSAAAGCAPTLPQLANLQCVAAPAMLCCAVLC